MDHHEGYGWTDEPRFAYDVLHDFVRRVFEAAGVPSANAEIVASGLLLADERGIETHGVQRIRFYLKGLAKGDIDPAAKLGVDREGPSTILFNGNRGMGLVMARHAMERVIEKARETGICLGTIHNSGHFGIAGAYPLMAAEQDMCGMAMTNTAPLVVPMFARDPALGTNPIAFACPTGGEPFCLDMSTSTVAVGKIEVARRLGIPVPRGWSVDARGVSTTDPFMADGLSPLGGARSTSGHKGYGLGLMVEIFCGQLAANAWSLNVGRTHAGGDGGTNGHMVMAWRVDAFRELDEFKRDMDEMLEYIREMEVSEEYAGQKVLIPGDPEVMATEINRREGIPVRRAVLEEMNEDAVALGVEPLA